MSTPLSDQMSKRIKGARKYPHRWSANVTLELLSPLHIGAGEDTSQSDAAVVVDANGLSTIPGSSIKGVLRSRFEAVAQQAGISPADVKSLFGFQSGDRGQGSRLRVTWGRVHDKNNRPVIGLLDPDILATDEVLASAALPELRDHASINSKGIAENKFDELSVPAGHRFSFQIELTSDNSAIDNRAWALLLHILAPGTAGGSGIRLGGKTRRGFGAAQVIALQPAQREAFETASASPDDTDLPGSNQVLLHRVALVPDTDCFWMFGGGDEPNEATDSDNSPPESSNPVRAGRVVWEDSGGRFKPNVLVIPGSSLKGPLRHRTRFHLCRQLGAWAENEDTRQKERVNLALALLFGTVHKQDSNDRKVGRLRPADFARAGCLYLDDIYLEGNPGTATVPESAPLQNHVTIDRVLGGALDHHLFTDRPLHGGGFTLRIAYQAPDFNGLSERELEVLKDTPDPASAARALLDEALKAFDRAIHDLKSGMLALGAHGNRGYGWFRAANTH